jgi:hypothetical protein
MKRLAVSLAALFLSTPAWSAEKPKDAPPSAETKAAAPNTLSPAEKAAGWRLLFDGKTSKGWRGLNRPDFPADGRWAIEGGNIHRVAEGKHVCDLVTTDEFDNFDLRWEWKISEAGNSGLKYLVDESMGKRKDDGVGFEYQMLDDAKHPDAKKGKDGDRTSGSLYDLIPAAKDKVLHPPGQWNESRVVVDGNHVEHWLNGGKVLSFERGSAEFKKLVAESKFKEIPRFGEVSKGHLLLQDHGNEVFVRNIKIKAARAKTASQ